MSSYDPYQGCANECDATPNQVMSQMTGCPWRDEFFFTVVMILVEKLYFCVNWFGQLLLEKN